MSKTCDWCGAYEPNAGSFSRTGERYSDTILCPDCCPDDEVDRGIFIVYSFTADRSKQNIMEAVINYLRADDRGIRSIKLVADVGPKASTDGHGRYALVIDITSGLSSYRLEDLLRIRTVIDAANGDPDRNNCRVKFYNYRFDDVLDHAEETTVVEEKRID